MCLPPFPDPWNTPIEIETSELVSMLLEFLSGERACGSKASESLEPLSSEVKFKLQQQWLVGGNRLSPPDYPLRSKFHIVTGIWINLLCIANEIEAESTNLSGYSWRLVFRPGCGTTSFLSSQIR